MTQTLFKGQLLLQKMNYVTRERLQKAWQLAQRTWSHSPVISGHQTQQFKHVNADIDIMKVYIFWLVVLFLW